MNYLQPYIVSFKNYLESSLIGNSPFTLYEPADYILSLGGKRIRPILVLLGTHLYEESFEKALDAAFAIEVFHNFTLVHDDIMDQAELRRGQLTVHKKYSTNQAILTGDVMLIHSYEKLLGYSPVLSHMLVSVFSKMAEELCKGQQMDMDFETRENVSIGDYIKMIELKTAVLLGAALKIGALIGNAADSDAEHLYQFGINFGIAFQLQDDVLDVFGASAHVGKTIGGDIIQNKKTYLFLKSLELASDEQKSNLVRLYSGHSNMSETDKVEWVTKTFTSLLVKEYAQQVMEAYRDLAISHVHSCSIDVGKKELLISLVNDFLNRES
ncbi:MAG: polyprenyl synthetase family protein [Saprospiraceae bacterium]|nr:polyprenyl synthetase family protein [Saprospiraceae bacterium]MBK8854578.1 polyprenyl synthetase family protein [Saprospiraceae bacterium]MBK9044465.1 polyprenyl synthetase family protein [Saprospiraceae bacterium]MBP6693994.1 polyprenyl synthetase family protein [Saprospiraceae bacterium]